MCVCVCVFAASRFCAGAAPGLAETVSLIVFANSQAKYKSGVWMAANGCKYSIYLGEMG